MKESTNIQIINNIRKDLSRNLSHLFSKTKNIGLEKSNTRFKGYKNNNKILKNNNKYNKRNINENSEVPFIIRKNNIISLKSNSNFLINNNLITDRILRNKNNYHLNNNSISKVKNMNLTQNNSSLSNVKYIFDNILILDNREKKNNRTMNLRDPETKEFIKKENNSKALSEEDISKIVNNDHSFKGNLTASNIKEKTNKEIEKNEIFKQKEIQSSKFSTSVASYNNFNIKNNINEYNKITNNNTMNKKDKNRTKLKSKKNSKNNFNIKNNKSKKEKNSEKKSEIIKKNKKNKENEKKDDEIKIKDENNINIIENQNVKVENNKINLLKQIEMDSAFGIGDYEVKNENQDSLFILTNNPSIHIIRNKINNCNLFFQEKHINNNIIKTNIQIKSHETSYTILGICDGHGEQGRTISNYISTIIPNKLKNVLNSMSTEKNFENEIEPIIKSIFSSTNTKLNTMQIIDTSYSGTCFCSLLLNSTSIISINLGNSKAIIGCRQSEENNKKKFYPFNITSEHTPLIKEEKERIIENGGDVSYEKDEYNRDFGPLKIWKKNVLVPGLLTTRSFGDKEASLIGLISEPEIKYYEMKSEYKFFVVGSFGLWNFIESDECIKIIGEFYLKNDIHGGVNKIMKTVKSRWIEEKEDIIEDISIIVGFLKEEE